MIIDVIFIVLVIAALVKGYSNGLIIGIFSLLALVIGLAAAIKLSVVTAQWLKEGINVAARWLPIIAFALVFLLVVLLVRLGAKALEKTAELAMLGWVNKLAGIVLYLLLYTLIFSVLLFYADKAGMLRATTIASSLTYSYIIPLAPKTMNAIGALLPVFKDMFHELEAFFAGLSDKLQH